MEVGMYAGEQIEFDMADSALGRLFVAHTVRGLCAVLPGDDDDALLQDAAARFPGARLLRRERNALTSAVVARVNGSEAAPAPLDTRGTPFQEAVWSAIQRVPRGTTVSYGALAAALGIPRSARAVARACGANPLAVIIPCHRVVRGDGGHGGFRWGLHRKALLLARETHQSL
jgi:AraC family transcriptional regulator, regulatory protein of adaptative response / methylated-DNA-[protein]-cysteine methyltransferase